MNKPLDIRHALDDGSAAAITLDPGPQAERRVLPNTGSVLKRRLQ